MQSTRMPRVFGMSVFIPMATLAAVCWPMAAQGQTTIAKWTWNNLMRNPPEIGAGTASYIGGTAPPAANEFPSGNGSSDGGAAWGSSSYPSVMANSGTAGVRFAVNTEGYQNIRVRYDAMASATGSRWLMLQYTTNGGVYINDPAGPKAFSNLSWANNRMLDLTGVPAANDNPQFAIRIVSVFSPNAFVANGTSYLANEAYQPSGTGAGQSYNGGTGTIRFDAVTVIGDPINEVPPGVIVAGAAPPAACPGGGTTLSATIQPGANPPSALPLTVTANLTSIGGGSSVALLDDGTPPDATGFDFIYTAAVSVSAGTSPGVKVLPISVVDHLLRSGTGSINLTVADCNVSANSGVVINRLYGAGGNAGASYNADFVELFNRGASTVNVTGWSLQYAAAAAATGFTGANNVIPLAGLIPPGGYYLVQMDNDVGVNGVPIPTPDAVAGLTSPGMAANAGRVALVEAIVTPIGNDLSAVRDLIGYGPTAVTFEGAGPAPELSAVLHARRKNDGCQDANQNFNDFEAAAPSLPTAPRNSGSPVAPCAATCSCRADVSGDGGVSGRDIQGFVRCVAGVGTGCDCGDLNNDTVVNLSDIGAFVTALLAGACAP